MATRVGPQHFAWFHWIGHPRKPPGRPKHLRSICHTNRVKSNFVQILGSKFWVLGGLNQKSKNNVLSFLSWRTDGQEMARFHQETKKKQCLWQTDTHRQTESTTKNNRLLARRGGQQDNTAISYFTNTTYKLTLHNYRWRYSSMWRHCSQQSSPIIFNLRKYTWATGICFTDSFSWSNWAHHIAFHITTTNITNNITY